MNTVLPIATGLMVVNLCGFCFAAFETATAPIPVEESSPMAVTTEAGAADEQGLRRDPFWPVGYEPPTPGDGQAAAIQGEDAIPDMPWPALPIRGRSRAADGTFRVFIDGVGIVGVNRVVSIPHQGYWFHWRIVDIDNEGVRSMRLGISKKKTSTLFPVAGATPRKEKTP